MLVKTQNNDFISSNIGRQECFKITERNSMQPYVIGNLKIFEGQNWWPGQLGHNPAITCMSMYMCAHKLTPSLGRQFTFILLSFNAYYCVWKFVPVLPQTHTYIQRQTWSKDKSTYSCCSPWIPCKAEDPLLIALSSLSLGISSEDMEVGSTFTKSKEKDQCGLQIYVPLL